MEFFTLTDTGRVRSNNEDAAAAWPELGLLVLADGMGGYNAGEIASRMALDLIQNNLSRHIPHLTQTVNAASVEQYIGAAVGLANRTILHAALNTPAYVGMGTTLVMALVLGPTLVISHLGDSRAYRWREGRLAQLTKDHSLLQEQIDAGLITPQQARGSQNRNLVTRALGVEPEILLETHCHEWQSFDLYLLCSDGLSDMLTDDEIARVLHEKGHHLDACAHALIGAANAAGGRDNIAVAMVKVHSTTQQ
jgi:PPM family protein phosphatase